MKIFISQSKERSHAVAHALRKWIPQVIQVIEGVWVSSEDIAKGSTWDEEVAGILEVTDFGIVCITPENKTEPWLLYEAGALSKHRKTSAVWTFLFDIQPTDIQSPLAKFQHTKAADKEDVFKMMQSINAALKKREEKPLAPEVLRDAFDNLWPALERALQVIPPPQSPVPEPPRDSEKINEILTTVRDLAQRMPPEGENHRTNLYSESILPASVRRQLLVVLSHKEQRRLETLWNATPKSLVALDTVRQVKQLAARGDFESLRFFLNEGWHLFEGESNQTDSSKPDDK